MTLILIQFLKENKVGQGKILYTFTVSLFFTTESSPQSRHRIFSTRSYFIRLHILVELLLVKEGKLEPVPGLNGSPSFLLRNIFFRHNVRHTGVSDKRDEGKRKYGLRLRASKAIYLFLVIRFISCCHLFCILSSTSQAHISFYFP